ncbi:MAG: hypothetical protein B6I18_01585 [Bacteroidetes bacterium 4572_112]|nr:MAG: hypothetical protein B6I18_01585 [Bacteroidetes bacterium 4572_112]
MKKVRIIIVILCFSNILIAQTPVLDWTYKIGASSWDLGWSTTIDNSGNIYFTGEFSDTVDFDPGIGVENLISAGSTDCFLQKVNSEGNLIWAKRIGGTTSDGAQAVTTDNQGNVYVTGYFSGTVYFDISNSNSMLIAVGIFDGFILKLDSNGSFIWVKHIAASNASKGWGISIDILGNVCTVGCFDGIADFDPGAGIMNLTCSYPYADVFVQKLDSNGVFLWAIQNSVRDMYNEVAINTDINGNIIITGYFRETVDFDPGPGVYDITAFWADDIFIQKLDTAGGLVWVKHMGNDGGEFGTAVTSDPYGNVVSTGYFGGLIDFDPGPGIFNLVSNGGKDIYVQKLSSNGSLLWVKQIGGYLDDMSRSITMDNEGNLYITGGFSGTVDFDPGIGVASINSAGGYDIYILKLDSLGEFVWVVQMGGTEDQYGYSIDTDNNGNVYSTGFFAGIVDFDPGTGVHNLSCDGIWDVFALKLSQSTGTYVKENDFNSLSVFPNPTVGSVNIDLRRFKDVDIEISSINGGIVYSKYGVKEQILNVELNVSPGVYFIRLSSNKYHQINKIIVK